MKQRFNNESIETHRVLKGEQEEREASMDERQFKSSAMKLIDYLINYLDTIHLRHVTPFVEPGYLAKCLPDTAPEDPEPFENILKDFDNFIMPGLTHWAHPRFFAFFPSGHSYPSLLGSLLCDGLGTVGFSWVSSPACYELEVVMLDWLARLLGLPRDFLSSSHGGKGGGVIQSTASDSVFASMIAARHFAIKTLQIQHPLLENGVLLSKLIAYCSKEAHSCIEKAAKLALVKLRVLDTDEKFQMTGAILSEALREDRRDGLVPFFVCATLGTPSCCSCDLLPEIGPLCRSEGIWLHVEAAYVGAALILPEFKHLRKGLRYASSFNMSPHKWLLTNVDCSCFWVQDKFRFTEAFIINPLYLRHKHTSNKAHIDLRNWGVPLTRRFRSLKLWFLFRLYGVEELQNYIRNHIKLAQLFANLVKQDARFALCNNVQFGLVCFRLMGPNSLNERLLSLITASGRLYLVPAVMKGTFVLRFIICHPKLTESDLRHSWKIIAEFANEALLRAHTQDDTISENLVQSDLQKKRSYFVRMTSDPKITNQRIVKFNRKVSVSFTEDDDEILTPFEKVADSPSIKPPLLL